MRGGRWLGAFILKVSRDLYLNSTNLGGRMIFFLKIKKNKQFDAALQHVILMKALVPHCP